MAKPGSPDVDRSELLFDQFLAHPEIARDYLQTFSKILGWDATNRIWRFLEVDQNGNLSVSLSSGVGGTAVITKLAFGVGTFLAVSANPSRKSLTINNTSTTAIYIGFNAGVVSATGILIGVNETFYEEHYNGAVWLVGTVVGRTADVLEIS